jgi:hypothetical protein
VGKCHGFNDADFPRDQRRAEKRQRREKIGSKENHAERFELDAETKKEPISDQRTRHTGAEVVDDCKQRHLGDKDTCAFGHLFFGRPGLVFLLADGPIHEQERDAKKYGQAEKRLVGVDGTPALCFLKKLRQAAGQSA